jgi:DNA-binding transcriptional LysR family regulator
MKLRRQSPQTTYHLHFGSGRELIRELQEGRIDALLTSAPITTEEFESLELAKESYVFVGSQQHAKSVRTPAHLSEVTLIEHDPSFPFLRYVAPSLRARMKFKDVWFLGSTRLMATAVLEGLGVSILPLYLVANDIRSGSIHSLDIDIGKANDHFRLLFLKNSGLKSRLAPLAEGLISNRLTN